MMSSIEYLRAYNRIPVWQRYLGDPARGDGHTSGGIPGDCVRACISTLTGVPYERVPHFALYVSWWTRMRNWARTYDIDISYVENALDLKDVLIRPGNGLFMGCGPSPRGPFRHCVIVDADLCVVWDPNPTVMPGDPPIEVDEVFVIVEPYDPPPAGPTLIGS